MPDLQRTADIRVRVNKEGQLDVFRDLAEDLGDVRPAAADAEKAVDRLAGSVEKGFGSSIRMVTRAREAIDEYREQLERVRDAGGVVTPEQLAKLDQLEKRYDSLTEKVGEYRVAQQRATKDIQDATEAAGGSVGPITDLGGAFTALGGTIATVGGPVLAIIATFIAAYKATRELAEGLEGLGVPVGEIIAKFTPGGIAVTALANAMAGAADDSTLLANQLNFLAHHGIDATGKSAEEVQDAFNELSAKLREGSLEANTARVAYQNWRAELGPTKDELGQIATGLAENIAKLKETETQLSEAEYVALVGPKIDALLAKYAQIGTEPPEHIRKLKAELDSLAAATAAATSDMAGRWGSATEEIARTIGFLRDALLPIPDDLAAQAEAVGISIGAWERQNVIFTALPGTAAEAGRAAEDAGTKAGDAAEGIGKGATAAGQLAKGAGDASAALGGESGLAGGAGKAKIAAGELEGVLAGIGERIKQEFTGASGFSQPIMREIQGLRTELQLLLEDFAKAKAAATEPG